MYRHLRYTASVRDAGARYHGAPHPAEPFAASSALLDLQDAAERDAPLIIARYAALRCWLLRGEGAAGPVVDHAESAAFEHLAAVEGAPGERATLSRLAAATTPPEALAELESAAAAAGDREHRYGAHALRQAAHRSRWAACRFPPPSTS